MAIFANESSGYVQQDVQARLDYGENWQEFMALAPSDSIASSVWVCSPAGLTLNGDLVDDNVASTFISGGVAGQVYRVQNTITTAQNRSDTRAFYISIVDSAAVQPIPLVTGLFDRFDGPRDFKASSLSFLDDSFPVDNLSDDVIWENLVAAEAEAERVLRVFFSPTVVIPDSAPQAEVDALVAAGTRFIQEDDYDFEPALWQTENWGYLVARWAPIISVQSVRVSFPSIAQPITEIPTGWLQIDKKYGHIRFVPTGSLMGMGPLNSFVMSFISAGRTIPGALQVRYTAGLADAKRDYPDLVNLVKRMAVMRLLKTAFLPTSASISADGLSQSTSFDMSKWQDDIDADLEKLRSAIRGIRLTVL